MQDRLRAREVLLHISGNATYQALEYEKESVGNLPTERRGATDYFGRKTESSTG